MDWEKLAAGILSDLKERAGSAWDEWDAERRAIVERTAKDLARITLKGIAGDEGAAEEAAFLKSTLASEAWLAEMIAVEKMREAALSVLAQLAGGALALL